MYSHVCGRIAATGASRPGIPTGSTGHHEPRQSVESWDGHGDYLGQLTVVVLDGERLKIEAGKGRNNRLMSFFVSW